eukprot:7670024-Pyramimonas_sp.AAC.1
MRRSRTVSHAHERVRYVGRLQREREVSTAAAAGQPQGGGALATAERRGYLEVPVVWGQVCGEVVPAVRQRSPHCLQ